MLTTDVSGIQEDIIRILAVILCTRRLLLVSTSLFWCDWKWVLLVPVSVALKLYPMFFFFLLQERRALYLMKSFRESVPYVIYSGCTTMKWTYHAEVSSFWNLFQLSIWATWEILSKKYKATYFIFVAAWYIASLASQTCCDIILSWVVIGSDCLKDFAMHGICHPWLYDGNNRLVDLFLVWCNSHWPDALSWKAISCGHILCYFLNIFWLRQSSHWCHCGEYTVSYAFSTLIVECMFFHSFLNLLFLARMNRKLLFIHVIFTNAPILSTCWMHPAHVYR